MMSLLNDPDIDKLIIFALLGMVAVLGIAVIVLAVKKNTYYVDNDGVEITPVSKNEALKTQSSNTYVPPVEDRVVEPVFDSIQPVQQEEAQQPVLATPISVKPTVPRGVSATVIVNGEAQQVKVNVLPAVLGRDSATCDLPIKEPAVSRRHARLVVDNGTLYLEDVSEHNGTYINGTKLPPLGRGKVQQGDKINLGRAEILIDKIIY